MSGCPRSLAFGDLGVNNPQPARLTQTNMIGCPILAASLFLAARVGANEPQPAHR